MGERAGCRAARGAGIRHGVVVFLYVKYGLDFVLICEF